MLTDYIQAAMRQAKYELMPRPIKRSELIRRLRHFGWEGPLQKGKHPCMVKAGLRQAGISPDVWEQS